MRKANKKEEEDFAPAYEPRKLSETELQNLWDKYHDFKNKNKGVFWYTARDDFLINKNVCNWHPRYGLSIISEIPLYTEADLQWQQFVEYEGKRIDAEKPL